MHSVGMTDRSISEAVGITIRSAIRRTGKTQDLVARTLGTSSPWITRRTSGHVGITLDELQYIADAIGVPVRELLPVSWR